MAAPKKLFLVPLFCIVSFFLMAQGQSDTIAKAPSSSNKSHKKFYNCLYGDILIDVLVSPYTVVPNYVENTNGGYPYTYIQQGNYSMQVIGVNLVSFGYKGWYNIVEFNDNTSLSLGAWPILGFGLGIPTGQASDEGGFFSFHMPVLAEFHFGNGATFNTSKEIGLTIGGGIEFLKCPIFQPNNKPLEFTSQFGGTMEATLTTAWIEPCVDLGLTFWTKSNHAVEIIAKYGFGNHTSFLSEDGVTTVSGGSNSYTLGVIYYLGY